jgi:DNA-binding response OmpR family regulator
MRNQSGTFFHATRALVLFVDNDDDLRSLYLELAESLGLSARLAARVDDGLDIARTERPDVVVLETGRCSTFLAPIVREWRAVVPYASLVAVTTDTRATDISLRRFGFDSVLRKPFALEAFDDAIASAVERASRRRMIRAVG